MLLDQAILELYVPVHDTTIVAICQGHQNIFEQDLDLLVVVLPVMQIAKITTRAILGDQVECRSVLIELIEVRNVWVVHSHHCFKFRSQHFVVCRNPGLRYFLHCTPGPSLIVLSMKDTAESALTQSLEDCVLAVHRVGTNQSRPKGSPIHCG